MGNGINRKIDGDRLGSIELVVVDVDGVLTDGKFIIMPSGDEYKMFNAKDGAGIKYWIRVGGKVALISGRESRSVSLRAEELGVDILKQGCKNKADVLSEVLAELDVFPSAAMVIGDDLPDLPMFHMCGLAACPSDAVEEVRCEADYVCRNGGGCGCVREVLELILKETGKWDKVMERYRVESDGSQG